MAETSDKQSKVVGEKSSYAIDASGQKGDVRFHLYTAKLLPVDSPSFKQHHVAEQLDSRVPVHAGHLCRGHLQF